MKRKITMIIAAMVIIVTSLSACAKAIPNTPEGVGLAAVTSWSDHDFASLRKLVHPEDKQTLSTIDKWENEYNAMKAYLVNTKHTYSPGKVNNITEDGSRVAANFEDEKGHIKAIRLKKIDGKWYFDGM